MIFYTLVDKDSARNHIDFTNELELVKDFDMALSKAKPGDKIVQVNVSVNNLLQVMPDD